MSPLARTQARSRTRHSSIALSTTLAKLPRDANSVDPHRERVTDRHAAERCPWFCSQLGLGRGCSDATDLGKWTLALSAPEIWQYCGLCVRVCCPAERYTWFVGNFFLFTAVQEFLKSIKIWQSYHQSSGPQFLGTQCSFDLNQIFWFLSIFCLWFPEIYNWFLLCKLITTWHVQLKCKKCDCC